MARKVEVDTNQLRHAATGCDHIHDTIARTLGTLRATVNGSGTPWGNDNFGNKFAQGPRVTCSPAKTCSPPPTRWLPHSASTARASATPPTR
ncbi:hypothetical protein NONI108955_06310 [Nocardia ninae]|uniref:hypothetical protein n=1 Tax=Nocardia ninae TaxID=356145 RepID=UPI0011BF792B|nr:hypothetical protein [Nocardia ninae]